MKKVRSRLPAFAMLKGLSNPEPSHEGGSSAEEEAGALGVSIALFAAEAAALRQLSRRVAATTAAVSAAADRLEERLAFQELETAADALSSIKHGVGALAGEAARVADTLEKKKGRRS